MVFKCNSVYDLKGNKCKNISAHWSICSKYFNQLKIW